MAQMRLDKLLSSTDSWSGRDGSWSTGGRQLLPMKNMTRSTLCFRWMANGFLLRNTVM